ncbi:autotransporter outer membrane beta-barrel domain-containing protein [Pseudovibrio exalbescens]|nr:autotransporter outer membrane beta-barrel domain-containing protein [Pseudovibrio exalbescens]
MTSQRGIPTGTRMILRGGRLKKVNGLLISCAPLALCGGLYLGSGIVPATAGSCTETGGVGSGIYTCTGAANAGADTTEDLDPAAGVDLEITTDPGFGIDTSTSGGAAFDIYTTGNGGSVQFTDTNASNITGESGILIDQTPFSFVGIRSITTNGTITATNGFGIDVYGNSDDITIEVNDVSGTAGGIDVENDGSGVIDITSTGDVSSTNGIGINTYMGDPFDTTTIDVVNVTGTTGISAVSRNDSISITSSGTITSTTGTGLFAETLSGYSGYIDVDVVEVDSAGGGIEAIHNGLSGPATVTAMGTIDANGGIGVDLTNNGTYSAVEVVDVNSTDTGIYVDDNGFGAVSVTSTGTIDAGNKGINVQSDNTTYDVTIVANEVIATDNGIEQRHYGGGNVSITANGLVDAGGIGIDGRAYAGSENMVITTSEVDADDDAIEADHYGTGILDINANGTLTSGNRGVDAELVNGTNLYVDAVDVDAQGDGLYASSQGTGFVEITATGDISAGEDGVDALQYTNGTDLTVTTNNITADQDGIEADNLGNGETIITANGDISAGQDGVDVLQYTNGTDVTVTTNAVDAGGDGINSNNLGTGETTITSNGPVTADGAGISATNYGATTTNLTVDAGDVSGASGGIEATNRGTGDTNVSSDGLVTSSGGIGVEATVANGPLTLDLNDVTGATRGISIQNYGSSGTDVTISGDVEGTGSEGLYNNNSSGEETTVTVTSTGSITGGGGTAILDYYPSSQMSVTSAGDITGDVILGTGDDAFTLTDGTVTGDIYGDNTTPSASDGNDTFTWTGGTLVGGFSGGDGDDTATVGALGPAEMSGTTRIDGGAAGEGSADTLTFDGTTFRGGSLPADDTSFGVNLGEGWDTINFTNGTSWTLTNDLTVDGNAINVDATSTLFGGDGVNPELSTLSGSPPLIVTNAGIIDLTNGTSGPADTFTITGNYVGQDGTLRVQTVLGDDASPTDRLTISGDTSGTTNVFVTNVGGTGAQTNNGILVVEVGGNSNGQFALANGDYVLPDTGEDAIIAGAFAYAWRQKGDGSWYLESQVTDAMPDGPSGPLYQPGVPIFEAYPQTLMQLTDLPSLRQRVGDRVWSGSTLSFCDQERLQNRGKDRCERGEVWGRVEGAFASFEPARTTSDTTFDTSSGLIQVGVDLPVMEDANNLIMLGFTGQYARSDMDVSSFFGNGSIDTHGLGVGATLTWYGEQGLYADAQGQINWYESDLRSDLLGNLSNDNDAHGAAISLEVGQEYAVHSDWIVTPQAQLVYANVGFNSFGMTLQNMTAARVSLDRADSLRGRLGVAAEHQRQWSDDNGSTNRLNYYGLANLFGEFLDGSTVDVSGVDLTSRQDRLWGGLEVGGTYSWKDDRFAVFGQMSADTSLAHFSDSYSVAGRAGLRVRW